MNIFSQNPRVPAVQEGQSNSTYCVLGVRVHCFFLLAICRFLFVSSQWLLWREVTNGKCGSSFIYNYCQRPVQLQVCFCILWLCDSMNYSFSGCGFRRSVASTPLLCLLSKITSELWVRKKMDLDNIRCSLLNGFIEYTVGDFHLVLVLALALVLPFSLFSSPSPQSRSESHLHSILTMSEVSHRQKKCPSSGGYWETLAHIHQFSMKWNRTSIVCCFD